MRLVLLSSVMTEVDCSLSPGISLKSIAAAVQSELLKQRHSPQVPLVQILHSLFADQLRRYIQFARTLDPIINEEGRKVMANLSLIRPPPLDPRRVLSLTPPKRPSREE